MVIVLVVVKWLLWRLWLFGCRCWLEMLLLVLNRVTNIGLANWHAKKKNNVKLPEIYSFIVFMLAIHSIWFTSRPADPVRTLRLCSALRSDNNYKLIKHYDCRHSRSMSKSFYHPLKGINWETFFALQFVRFPFFAPSAFKANNRNRKRRYLFTQKKTLRKKYEMQELPNLKFFLCPSEFDLNGKRLIFNQKEIATNAKKKRSTKIA